VTATISPDAWTQIIVGLSIFVPVIVAAVLAVVVLRGKKHDPDEPRWQRLAAQQRDADRDADQHS
jgi:heme/copper-type cytochrome/quinol oxidase subunit 2